MTAKLKGLNLLNTRPIFGGAQARLTEELKEHHAHVIELPLQTLTPIPAQKWHFDFNQFSHIQMAIFVSPIAVHAFVMGIQNAHIQLPENIKMVAIGSGTAKTLSSYGYHVDYYSEHATSEFLMQAPILSAIENQHILWVKGSQGRKLIGDTLKFRGAIVHPLIVYKSENSLFNHNQLSTLWENDNVNIIIITSEQGLFHFWDSLPIQGKKWFKRIPLLVFSERIAKSARSFLNQPIYVCKHSEILAFLINYKKGL